jgi:hypothetical protein
MGLSAKLVFQKNKCLSVPGDWAGPSGVGFTGAAKGLARMFSGYCADDKWKKTQKSSFRKPVLSPPLFPGVWEFNNGRLFGSQSKQSTHARTAAAAPPPYSSLTGLPWFLVNDAADPRLLFGFASSDSFRDGIPVHTTCR